MSVVVITCCFTRRFKGKLTRILGSLYVHCVKRWLNWFLFCNNIIVTSFKHSKDAIEGYRISKKYRLHPALASYSQLLTSSCHILPMPLLMKGSAMQQLKHCNGNKIPPESHTLIFQPMQGYLKHGIKWQMCTLVEQEFPICNLPVKHKC